MKVNPFSLFITILFLFGGAIQYLGLLSPTMTNGVLLILGAIIIIRSHVIINLQYRLFIIIIIYLAIIWYITNSSISSLFVYLYYIICAFTAIHLGQIFYFKTSPDKSRKYIEVFIFLQAVVTTLQSIITGRYASHAQESDLIFGTLFLSSDGALAACVSLMMVILFRLSKSRGRKLCFLVLALIVCLNGNSKAGLLIFLITSAALLPSLLIRSSTTKYIYLLVLLVAVLVGIQTTEVYDTYLLLKESFINDYEQVSINERARRFAPLGQIISGNVNFLGKGLLTYYNPLNKKWLYDSGFGTFYTLAIDVGLISALAYILIFFVFIQRVKDMLWVSIIFLIFISYSFFNFSLSDLSFMFVLSFVVTSLTNQRGQDKISSRSIQIKTAPLNEKNL